MCNDENKYKMVFIYRLKFYSLCYFHLRFFFLLLQTSIQSIKPISWLSIVDDGLFLLTTSHCFHKHYLLIFVIYFRCFVKQSRRKPIKYHCTARYKFLSFQTQIPIYFVDNFFVHFPHFPLLAFDLTLIRRVFVCTNELV